jgi:hypothetical protein
VRRKVLWHEKQRKKNFEYEGVVYKNLKQFYDKHSTSESVGYTNWTWKVQQKQMDLLEALEYQPQFKTIEYRGQVFATKKELWKHLKKNHPDLYSRPWFNALLRQGYSVDEILAKDDERNYIVIDLTAQPLPRRKKKINPGALIDIDIAGAVANNFRLNMGPYMMSWTFQQVQAVFFGQRYDEDICIYIREELINEADM